MKPLKKPPVTDLENSLGYHFKDSQLLKAALTHASARIDNGGTDNERLEFLGDRVLGLCVAAMLYERLPAAREVELARFYNSLVCMTCCAEMAEKLDLGPHLILASSEARSGGRKKAVILADACEALLGAIYIDGGFGAAEKVIDALWGPLTDVPRPPTPDAKTALQEYAQSQKRGLPQYKELDRSGADHAPNFIVEVRVEGIKPAQGSGPSLKKAQQSAAEALLTREKVWPESTDHD